jgi:hypothetical protein
VDHVHLSLPLGSRCTERLPLLSVSRRRSSLVVSSHVLALWWLGEAAMGFYGIVGPWGTHQGAKGSGLAFWATGGGGSMVWG